jgi:hypothetical protein
VVTPLSLAEALTACAESVREVAQDYEDSRSNMPESLQDGNVGSEMQEKTDALNTFADALDDAASDSEITDWDMDAESPNPAKTTTTNCAVNNEDDAPDKKADEDAECDCGYDKLQKAKDEWEQEREDKVQAAIDRAQTALDELSI